MNMFDFGAFQEKLHMLSRAKYLFQRLFGAFQDTPRIRNFRKYDPSNYQIYNPRLTAEQVPVPVEVTSA